MLLTAAESQSSWSRCAMRSFNSYQGSGSGDCLSPACWVGFSGEPQICSLRGCGWMCWSKRSPDAARPHSYLQQSWWGELPAITWGQMRNTWSTGSTTDKEITRLRSDDGTETQFCDHVIADRFVCVCVCCRFLWSVHVSFLLILFQSGLKTASAQFSISRCFLPSASDVEADTWNLEMDHKHNSPIHCRWFKWFHLK